MTFKRKIGRYTEGQKIGKNKAIYLGNINHQGVHWISWGRKKRACQGERGELWVI